MHPQELGPPPEVPEAFNLADYFLFDRLSEGLGEEPAIYFGTQVHRYAEVAARSEELAAHLIAAGVPPGGRVLVILEDTPVFAWAIFATLRSGAVLAMGNPAAPPESLEYLVRYTGAAAIITDAEVAPALERVAVEGGARLIVARRVATGEELLGEATASEKATSLAAALADGARRLAQGAPSRRATHRDEPAIWLFTSGSTGQSKAAMHAHGDFAFNTERYAVRTVGYRRDDITVSVPRLFFGYATGTNLFFPFRVGAATALFAERPTPESLSAAIARHRPTIVTNVPTMMSKLLDDDAQRRASGHAPLDLSSVRFHLSAGEALPQPLLERFMARFGGEVYDGIGSAEMFHIYCTNRPGDIMPGSLGRPVEGYEIRLLPVDARGSGAAPAAIGETGVMWVRGDSVAFGYHRDREKSWQTFHGHWCRTGDLFRVDERGHYWFEGRADDLLKVGGKWVAPIEVEACIQEHAAVSAAAVIGIEHEGLVKPKAFVVLKPEERAGDPEALALAIKEHVKARLDKHKYPRSVAFVDDLPKNDRGKIDRRALEAAERAGKAKAGH
jgi:benzoate-CoA ligase family protein